MRNFWDLNYGEPGFKFFGAYHFACLFIIFIFGVFLYKPWKNNKKFRKIFAILPISLEIIRLIAVLICSRKISDSAKLILIFWCILAFVSLGFEHSVANMTCFALAKMLNSDFTFALILKNLIPVTIGNIIGGALVALTYNTIASDK